MPAPGTRPKRRGRLTMQSNLNGNPSIKNSGKKMTVQEMKAQREKEELSEFERLRLKAQEKQRAKLTAIRQAESDMVAKSIQRKSNTINRRINGRSNDTQMDDIRERHKKKQLAKKGKMEQTRRKKEKKLRNQELM